MSPSFDKHLNAYSELATFLRDSIRKGIIPKRHLDTVNTILDAEQNNVLYALEILKHLPDDHPLSQMQKILLHQEKYKPNLLNSHPNSEMTFQNYVNGSVNKLSYKIANSIVKGTSEIFFSILYLHAPSGMGKTHLLSAITNEMNKLNNDALLMNIIDLELELHKASQHGAKLDVHHWILNHKAILIDDVQNISGNFALQKELCAIIKAAATRSIPVVMSANCETNQLTNIEKPLIDLAQSGVTAQIQLPEQEYMCQIVQNNARKSTFPSEVAQYLSENITDNVRHLVASVKQIIALSLESETQITIDLARAVAPTEQDLRSSIPLLEPSVQRSYLPKIENQHSNEHPTGSVHKRRADIFKEMLASAQNEEEQCLALQIAVSEKINELRKTGTSEEIAKLKTALDHLRAGEIREALNCTSL